MCIYFMISQLLFIYKNVAYKYKEHKLRIASGSCRQRDTFYSVNFVFVSECSLLLNC